MDEPAIDACLADSFWGVDFKESAKLAKVALCFKLVTNLHRCVLTNIPYPGGI